MNWEPRDQSDTAHPASLLSSQHTSSTIWNSRSNVGRRAMFETIYEGEMSEIAGRKVFLRIFRHFVAGETLRLDVASSFPRKSENRTRIDRSLPLPPDRRLAEKPAGIRKARLHLQETSSRRFCGWLLLALLSAACHMAKEQLGVLGRQTCKKPGTRPTCDTNSQNAGVERPQNLGARIETHASRQTRIAVEENRRFYLRAGPFSTRLKDPRPTMP